MVDIPAVHGFEKQLITRGSCLLVVSTNLSYFVLFSFLDDENQFERSFSWNGLNQGMVDSVLVLLK